MRLDEVLAALDRRLDPSSNAPVAVGFSGGGDSLALLIAALDWGRAHGRPVLALTVDHGLQAASAGWTRDASAKATALSAQARALAWTGDKPAAGLPAAARRARHALLAAAAREAGARVLLMGHTADDLAEAALMREAGSTVSDPRDWSPSPVWPDGRDVFLLRPMLSQRRAAIRDWLAARGETWLDDPANDDPRFARARARQILNDAKPPASAPAECRAPPAFEGDPAGLIVLPRDVAARHLAAACLCAAGTERPPRGERLERLMARLAAGERFVATLAGARIEAGEAVRVCRDAGETARGGLSPLILAAGETGVWDGRFEVTAGAEPVTVRPLKGLAAALPDEQRRALKPLPPMVRATLPVIVDAQGVPTCAIPGGPAFAAAGAVRVRPLVLDRFRSATGYVDQECVT